MNGFANFGDLVGGFQGRSAEIRDQGHADAQRQADRDNKIFDALANSDDPDIRAAAVTGLLTGDHPARGMDKWFGKASAHPAYETIHGLINDGHQPFMNPTDRKATEHKNLVQSNFRTAEEEGYPLSEEEGHRMIMGSAGALPPRPVPRQYGTIIHSDDSSEPGSFDPADGQHYDQYGAPANDMKDFRHGGLGAPPSASAASAGGKWVFSADSAGSQSGTYQHVDAMGKPMGQPVKGTAGSPPSYSPVETSAGLRRFNTREGSYSEAPGAGGQVKAEPPTANLGALRDIEASILKAAGPRPTSVLGAGFDADPKRMQAWKASTDQAAVRYGYPDYAALQAAIGQAGQGVGAATPSTLGTPPPAAPALPTQTAPPTRRGTPQPAKKPGAAGAGAKPAGAPGGINADAVLKYLQKFDK